MIAWLVRHRAPVFLVTFCIVVFGVISYRGLPREANPDVKVPVVLVTTPYIGVSPADIESLITVPLERELSGLKDLKKMSSTSAEGASIVTLEFEPEVVIEDAVQHVRERVNRAKDLPEDAEDTDVREISFSDFPILIVTLSGGPDDVVLKRIGEDLADDLKRISGVLDAKLSGGRERELSVDVDPFRLQHYGLSLNDVIGAISEENVNVPGGEVRSRDTSYLLRVPGELKTASDIESVAVKRVGDRPVFVRDLGKVSDGFAERQSYSRLDGQPAVSIAVTKRAGANILDLADQVRALLAEREKGWGDVRASVQGDQSRYVRDMVSELENNIASALVLVLAVIIVFMGFRNALFVASAIPLSMLLSYIVLSTMGTTLNMVVLFSLILALGMLVDNGIVLVENVYRHTELGKGTDEAAIEGTREIAMPIAASTATTIAAFAPLLFWSGIMGQFMGYLPLTVIVVLSASLAVAVAILPVFAARFLRAPKPNASAAAPGALRRGYQRFLEAAIDHRYLTLVGSFVLLVCTFFAYGALNHGTEFFPATEPDQATVSITLPDGADLEATDRVVRRVEEIIAAEKNIDVFVAETGVSGGGNDIGGAQAASNQARITVDFPPHSTKARPGDKPRVEDTNLTIDRIRDAVQAIPGATIVVDKQRMGPPVGKPVAVEVSGESFHEVGALAAVVRRGLAEVPGVADVTDDYRVGRPEMRLRIDRGAAKRVGASTQAIAGTVRSAIAGTKASAVRDGEDEHDIVVRLDPRHRQDLDAVLALRIPGREDTSPNTYAVPLSAVATYALAGGSGSIRHIDQKLVVTIQGDVLPGENENEVRARVVERLAGFERKPGYDLRLGGADDEQRKTQEFLGWAFSVAVALIALILVAQFNSFATPLVILGSVVLSLVGVLWGLIITGTPFGVLMTGIGVISLAGVVVNNAIVLLDYVAQLRGAGTPLREALVEAGVTRLRPVLLTAFTTILGLVPMATGASFDFATGELVLGSQSADWWGPMAVAVIFGLAFATLLTLIVVPTMFHAIEDLRGLPARLSVRLRRVPPASAAPSEAQRSGPGAGT